MKWKGYRSKQVGPNLRSYHICLKGPNNNKVLDLYLNLEPPKNGGGLLIPLSCSAHSCYMSCEVMYFLNHKTHCFLFPSKSPNKMCQHVTTWSCINMTITETGIPAFAGGITWLTIAGSKTIFFFYICTVHSRYEDFFIKIQLMHSL